MNIPKIADAIGYIDNELITATLEAPPKKRHNPVMKWMTAAACLTLFVIAGILIPHLLKNDATAESKYKYHVSKTERAIEWEGHGGVSEFLQGHQGHLPVLH